MASVSAAPVPPVGGGAGAISEFYANIKQGKYVTARCKAKKTSVLAITDYADHPQSEATASEKCKRKR